MAKQFIPLDSEFLTEPGFAQEIDVELACCRLEIIYCSATNNQREMPVR